MRILALAALLSVGACGRTPPPEPTPAAPVDRKAECCTECTTAASLDPAGMSLDLVSCADYATYVVNGAPAMSAECGAWFSDHPAMVQDCR